MRYMLLIYLDEQALSEPERQACYRESTELAHRLNATGKYLDANPLYPTSTATSVRLRDGKRVVTDGPFAETREQLGGYFMIDAGNLDEAIAIAERIPMACTGTVEVRPIVEIPNLPRREGTSGALANATPEAPARPAGKPTGVWESLARPGGLSYLEIAASDPGRSAAFYERVCGWKVERRGADDFRFEDATGHLIGRWTSDRAVGRELGLLPYVYVDGVDDAAERSVALGGEIFRAPYAEGDVRVATIRDPAGNLIGLWQAASLPEGD